MKVIQNSSNVLNNIANEFENVENIRKRLFSVYDVQVPAPERYIKQMLTDSSYDIEHINSLEVELPDTKIIYNSNGQFLGHAGRVYESIQPETFLNSVVGSLEGCESGQNFDLSKLEYRELKDGKLIHFRLPLGEIGFKNMLGKDDVCETKLDFFTGFGGTQVSTLGLFFHCLICSNGMRAWKAETELKAKHTAKMNQKVLLYCDEILRTVAKVQEQKELWTAMDKKQVDVATVERFANLIAGVKKEETKETMSTKKLNILNNVNAAIQEEFARRGASVWGLLNGATNYTNHYASGHESEEYVLVATGAKINELAQKEAIALLN